MDLKPFYVTMYSAKAEIFRCSYMTSLIKHQSKRQSSVAVCKTCLQWILTADEDCMTGNTSFLRWSSLLLVEFSLQKKGENLKV